MQGYLKRIYSKLTLHQKVRLTILAFSILPLICLACISLSFIYKNRIEKIHDEVYEEMQNRFQDMNYSMSTMEIMGKTIWSNTTFITEIGKAALNGDLKGYNRYIFQDHTLSILRVVTSVSQVRGARIYLDYPGLREYPPYLYRMDRAEVNRWYEDRDSLRYDGAWYMNVTEQQIYGTYSDYYLGTGMAAYVFPLRITSNLTGIFEIVLPMEAVVPDIFDDTGKRDVFLIDEKGQFHGANKELIPGGFDTEDLAKLMGVSALKDYKENGIQLYHGTLNHTPVLLSVTRDEKKNTFLMQLTLVKDQYFLMAWDIFQILILEVLLIVILIRAINGIVNHLLRDFNVFSQCIQRVGEGNLDVVIPPLEQVEINAVAIEYNRMLIQVKQLMELNIHREVMVKEAQLKSLEKQIDSHFLYNVLDSIKMMAEVKGIYNVSDALLALGKMFRYNLQIDRHNVTLYEEITYLESYIKLCNIRYDYYINLSKNVEEGVLELKVPKIILQPIAENSIIYGLDELQEDTTIYLKAYVKDKCAYIEMTDMGKGMDEETLEKVRSNTLSGTEDSRKTHGGIGLYNIQERIRLMYGEEYGVDIYSKKDCYTKVILRIYAGETE